MAETPPGGGQSARSHRGTPWRSQPLFAPVLDPHQLFALVIVQFAGRFGVEAARAHHRLAKVFLANAASYGSISRPLVVGHPKVLHGVKKEVCLRCLVGTDGTRAHSLRSRFQHSFRLVLLVLLHLLAQFLASLLRLIILHILFPFAVVLGVPVPILANLFLVLLRSLGVQDRGAFVLERARELCLVGDVAEPHRHFGVFGARGRRVLCKPRLCGRVLDVFL